jgi:hypothetical protein
MRGMTLPPNQTWLDVGAMVLVAAACWFGIIYAARHSKAPDDGTVIEDVTKPHKP